MRLHYLQHVPFEGLGCIASWAEDKGYPVTVTRLYAGDPLPEYDAFDWLIVLGGPMGIYDDNRYPWLSAEKTFIRGAVDAQKIILGICLGAQLIADILGGPVTRNPQREIGWFPLRLTEKGAASSLFVGLPDTMLAFHWHGDTFALPPQAELLASSEGCLTQAFIYNQRVVGFQFHLEVQPENAQALITHCGDEIGAGPYMQTSAQMLADENLFKCANNYMYSILDQVTRSTSHG
jgi:GMP synthase (glutamine-hydrolysing)